jgi:acetylornithine deacetylase/succinyl-diaminopimelate desuccinylase-like protein
LVALVEIDSQSTHEHEVADHLETLAGRLGLPVRRQPVEGAGPNILIGSDDPLLLVTAHMDTVVPTWDWSGTATVSGDIVSGLGAQDDKGPLVSALLAMLMVRDAGMDLADLPVLVGLTVDEEQDGTGSMSMAKAVAPPHVIALEGTDLQICVEEAGTVEGRIEVTGRTSHGSQPEHGVNAVHKAIELVAELRALPVMSRPHGLAGDNALSVMEFRGGSDLFVIPDHACVHVDVRVGGVGEATEVHQALLDVCERHGASFDLVEAVEPVVVATDAPLVRSLGQAVASVCGSGPVLGGMTAWTDAHSFAEAGSDAVVFGPGNLQQAHRVDERISVTEIVTCARILADVMARVRELPRG